MYLYTGKQNCFKKCIHNSKCVSQLVLPCFQAKVEEFFVLCCFLQDTRVICRLRRARLLSTPQHISLRIAVSRENAKHMPMKWLIGLSIGVLFSSVTPSIWQGFVPSFKVDRRLRIGVNVEN